jgi:hypothetical protein
MVFDAFRNKTVLFSGLGMSGQLSDETWELTGDNWALVTVLGAPPARDFHAMSFDSVAHVVVMTGGSVRFNIQLNDAWQFNGSTWTALPVGPPKRAQHAIVFDTERERTVVFGGFFFAGLTAIAMGDTWTLGSGAPLWEDQTAATDETPILRHSAMAFDSVRGKLVVVGGVRPLGGLTNLTWEFDGQVWRNRDLSAPTRAYHAVVFDSVRRQIVMFGGSNSLVLSQPTDEIWILRDGMWHAETLVVRPAPRVEHAMAFDVRRGKTVLFGGLTTNTNQSEVVDGDTWEYDGAWLQVTPATAPPARSRHAMAYDAKRDRVVLFGGATSLSNELTVRVNDTWEFDGTIWTPWLPPANSVLPSPSIDAAMAFDAKRGVIVLFGGQTEFGPSNEVWEFDGVRWTRQLPLNATVPSAAPLMTFDTLHNNVLLLAGATFVDDLRSYTFTSAHPAEQCIAGTDGDNDGLSVCADPDCFGRCFPACSATYSGPCDRLTGPRCGDRLCNPALEDYAFCPGDCPPP